jgi:hypothetical protein
MSETIEQVHARWLQMRQDSADHDGGYPATEEGRFASLLDHVRLAEPYGPLLAEVARLWAALDRISCYEGDDTHYLKQIAAAALAGKEE